MGPRAQVCWGDSYLGIAFSTHPGNQTSSRGEAKDTGVGLNPRSHCVMLSRPSHPPGPQLPPEYHGGVWDLAWSGRIMLAMCLHCETLQRHRGSC